MKNNFLLAVFIVITTTSCGVNNDNDGNIDPYKNFNKTVFATNQKIDEYITRPIAQTYAAIVPDQVEYRISNIFSNANELSAISNDILQLEFVLALSDSWRFVVNSTLGIAGIFDVATELNLPKHNQYFGITLAKWGFVQSPYIVLPILGSSTIYDGIALPVDGAISIMPYISQESLKLSLYATETINARSKALDYDNAVADAFDPYIFVRNAYLQKREKLIENILSHNTVSENSSLAHNEVEIRPKKNISNDLATIDEDYQPKQSISDRNTPITISPQQKSNAATTEELAVEHNISSNTNENANISKANLSATASTSGVISQSTSIAND